VQRIANEIHDGGIKSGRAEPATQFIVSDGERIEHAAFATIVTINCLRIVELFRGPLVFIPATIR
jgi:hypothetical protein